MGGGGFQMEPDNPLLDDHVLALARERSGPRPAADLPDPDRDRRRSGADRRLPAAVRAEGGDRASWACSTEPTRTSRTLVLAQDAVYVDRRQHGEPPRPVAAPRARPGLRAAWNAGVVMAGMSAGAICWFESCTTDSFGPTLRPLHGGLGILDGSFIPHYHGEGQRRPLLLGLVGDGDAAGGLRGRRRRRARLPRSRRSSRSSTSDPAAGAWRVEPDGAGGAIETALPTRFLGADESALLAIGCHAARTSVPGRDRPDRVGALGGEPAGGGGRDGLGPARRDQARRDVGERGEDEQPLGRLAMGDDEQPVRLARVERQPSGGRSIAGARGRTRAGRGRARAGPSARAPARPNARSSCFSATSRATAPDAGSGPAGTSSATTAFRKRGWSTTPTGAVSYSRLTAWSRVSARAASARTPPATAPGRIAEVGPEPDVRADPPHRPALLPR